jgi:hypothetical protein
MKARTHATALGVGLLALGLALAALPDRPVRAAELPPQVKAGEFRISGPYTHANLAVFLIHGSDRLKGKKFVTLQEALEQKKAVVNETQNVNRLTIENTSPDTEVYVQSGDILKGGQQDRIIAFDLIVPAKSGKLTVDAFCVEAGRWQQRGAEPVMLFAASASQVPAKGLKLAAKGGAGGGSGAGISGVRASPAQAAAPTGQGAVWMEVDALQRKLQMNLRSDVRSAASRSSLQLTLENPKVQEAAAAYTKALTPIVEGQKDVIGYAFAINGQVNSVEVYASQDLFRKLWPKLLRASAVEALAERKPDTKPKTVGAEAVVALMRDAEKGKATDQEVTGRIRLRCHETQADVLFETCDRDQEGAWLHRSYLKK